MRDKITRQHPFRRTGHHPGVSFGIFLIVLGLALLVATNDWLHLGSMSAYFNWKTVLIFIGILLLFNLEFTGGFVMIAAGIWFLQDQLFPFAAETFRDFFWPAVIALVGLSFIVSAIIKRK